MSQYIALNILQCAAVLMLSFPWMKTQRITGSVNTPVSFTKAEKDTWLYWAELLADHTDESNTDYRHKQEIVSWRDKGDQIYQSHTDCSGLINALIRKSSHDDKILKNWFGTSRPLAIDYYHAISTQNNFSVISNIKDLLPGDLIVIKYADRSTHDDNTGHCLLVDKSPSPCRGYPELPGTRQYVAGVIDSSKSPHGKQDTRHSENGEPYPGLGKGLFRLYTDVKGEIIGYSWSMQKPHEGFDPFTNPIIAGRPIL